MPFPAEIVTRQVSVGGAMIIESATPIRIQASVKASRSLINEATGYRFETIQTTLSNNTAGAPLTLELPVTDRQGWRDARTNKLIVLADTLTGFSHTYTLTVAFVNENNQPITAIEPYVIGPFVVPTGTGVFDVDTMIPGAVEGGGSILLPPGSGGGGGSGGSVAWADITGKPATFAPIIGASSTQAVAGNDARLSDARIPIDNSVTSAKIVDGSIVNADINTSAAIAQSKIANLVTDLGQKAPLDSPVFIGDPKAPTPATSDNDTSIATTAYTRAAIEAYAPLSQGGLDAEGIRDTIGVALVGAGGIVVTPNDAAETITVSGSTLAPLASPTFTGDPKAPTPGSGDNDTSLATTAYTVAAASFVIRWTGTAWERARTPNAPFGGVYLSTNDPNATPPTDAIDGDIWERHFNAV